MPPKPPETKNPPGTAAQSRARLRKKTSSPRKKTSSPRNHAQSWNSWNFLIISNGFCWWRIQQAKKPQKKWFSNQCLGSVLFYTTQTYTANSWKTKNLSFKTYLCCRKAKALCWKTKNIIVFLDNSKSLAQPSGVLGISRTRLFRGLWPDPSKLENLVGTLLWLAPKALRSLRGCWE